MMRSLFSGVTGLRSHQTKMDVIGNNIANVNTTGFKKSVVTFKDLYSQTISNAAAATGSGTGSTGGVNAKQIGLGSTVGAIATIHTPGSAQYTGNTMDVAISGDGYFTLQTPTGYQYSRSGNFYTDTAGNLVNECGYYVMTVAPITSGTSEYTLKNVTAEGLVSGLIAAPSAGSIRTGNITAELAEVMNRHLGFKFVADDPKALWQGTILKSGENVTLNGSTVIADPSDPANFNFDVNLEQIKDYMEDSVNNGLITINTGAKDIYFDYVQGTDGSGNYTHTMNMYAGETLLASADVTSINTATATLEFKSTDGAYTFASMALSTTASSGVLSGADIGTAFDNVSVSTITLEEKGSWYVTDMDTGETLERASIATESTVSKFVPANSEIEFTTPNFGTFRLKVTGDMGGNMDLSKAMTNSSFIVNADEEYSVNYSSPPDVSESSIETMKIDFSRYNNISIDPSGAVIGQLKRAETVTLDDGTVVNLEVGDKVVLGYIPLATFNNPSGLEKASDNMYVTSSNSGAAGYGIPGTGAVGALTPSNLEMSNVDLSEEMVNMIITQRGFQANSRIITTTDSMLEELVNLKR